MFRLAFVSLLVPATAFAEAPECPTGKALHATAQAAWKGIADRPMTDNENRDIAEADVSCIAIHGKQPALLLYDEAGAVLVGKTVTWHRVGYIGTPGAMYSFLAADLDGDGQDELLEFEYHWGHMGYSDRSFWVNRVVDGQVADASERVPLGWTDGDRFRNDCHADVQIVPGPGKTRRIAVTGIVDTGRADDPDPDRCALRGRHVYKWTNDELVLVK